MDENRPFQFRRLFSEMVSGPDEDIDLAKAALYISGEEYLELDVVHYLDLLDSLVEGATQHTGQGGALDGRRDLRATAHQLSEYLFVHQGFRGNEEGYYDPRNSYLNQVLDRRIGIPITLSLVYIEVARRLGIVFEGIGLPGHFVIRTGPPDEELYVDPFHGGQLLSRRDCERTVQDLFHGRVEFREDHLRAYTKKELLARILTNLKHNYFGTNDHLRALSCAELISAVDPLLVSNLKEMGWIHYNLKQYRMAINKLETYLKAAPQAEDAEEVRKQIQAIWSTLSTLN